MREHLSACCCVAQLARGGLMASYHLSVKTIKRSAGRTATAAGAYRAGERIECQREGRVHDYTRKQGIEETFIVTPENAPAWAEDRASLWNEAEASETRRNSVTAREWELALPSEISAEDRSQITRGFAEELVSRYGIAVDVAIHAPNREGDQRNHHAHVLTSTRKLEAEGFTAKTRVLDSARTGGVEIEQMRGVWAQLQNRALERAGRERGLGEDETERVDHRSLEVQRSDAVSRGDDLTAQGLDRAPELKLGPAANAMERREKRAAEREGRAYQPLTERGAVVHAARQARELFVEMRERLEMARGAYDIARDAGQGRVSAGLVALRAVANKDRSAERNPEDVRERLAQITGRAQEQADVEQDGLGRGRDRLRETLDRGSDGLDTSKEVEKPRSASGWILC
nr:MobQ family relaxase [Roseobacter litoralis]